MLIFNINTFHKNLDILRKIAGLKKSEFSAMLGVKNVFRKDYNSIGPKILIGIQQHFEGVDETWLLEEHTEEQISIMLKKRHTYIEKPEHAPPTESGVLHDGDIGTYGIPDLSSHRIKRIMASLSPEEMNLIEAIRAVDPISRIGIFSSAINQFNEAKRNQDISVDKDKINTINTAIKVLSRAISES